MSTNGLESREPENDAAPLIRSVAIFANPIAGRGKGRQIAQLLSRRLESNRIKATTILEAPSQAVPGQFRDVDAVIAIGGDGTLRAVAGRFHKEIGLVPPMLAIPMGTANLLNKHLGVEWNSGNLTRRVVESIRRRRLLPIDAAQANGELFLLMAGIGIDARIVHELDRIRSGPINYMSYLMPAAMAFTGYEYTPLTIDVDGACVFPSAPAMAFIGNVSEYGTGFPLLPNAIADDGLLDVCVVPVRSRGHAIKQFLRAAAGELLQAEGVVYTRGREIRIESPEPVPMQIDGDAAGHTPVRIGLLPIQVPFIVPV